MGQAVQSATTGTRPVISHHHSRRTPVGESRIRPQTRHQSGEGLGKPCGLPHKDHAFGRRRSDREVDGASRRKRRAIRGGASSVMRLTWSHLLQSHAHEKCWATKGGTAIAHRLAKSAPKLIEDLVPKLCR